jgi:hypothetical protein
MAAIHVIHREPQDFQRTIPAEQLLEIYRKNPGSQSEIQGILFR